MRIVFMGTPEFAVPSLQALIDAGHDIAGVFTQPDKKKGRGHHMLPPPVKELALQHSIDVYQPTTLRNNDSAKLVQSLKPDVIIVVAYGKILPKEVLDIPQMGCINVHGSLLPKYRGAAPIQWSVLNGEKTAGVTTMLMAEGLDTGDMLLKKMVEIGCDETAHELYSRLSKVGAELLVETLEKLDSIVPEQQNNDDSSSAPMLSKEMCSIDFSQPAHLVHNHIRGLSDWPCAEMVLQEQRLKVYKSRIVPIGNKCSPRELLDRKRFIVGCGDSTAIELVEVQCEGSKRMVGADFLRGNGQKLVIGDII